MIKNHESVAIFFLVAPKTKAPTLLFLFRSVRRLRLACRPWAPGGPTKYIPSSTPYSKSPSKALRCFNLYYFFQISNQPKKKSTTSEASALRPTYPAIPPDSSLFPLFLFRSSLPEALLRKLRELHQEILQQLHAAPAQRRLGPLRKGKKKNSVLLEKKCFVFFVVFLLLFLLLLCFLLFFCCCSCCCCVFCCCCSFCFRTRTSACPFGLLFKLRRVYPEVGKTEFRVKVTFWIAKKKSSPGKTEQKEGNYQG